nr:sugar-binding domain-containing protein [Melissococcus plutonius]
MVFVVSPLLDHEEFLTNLCEQYYINNQTITDLSEQFNLSRYKILKYLDEAKERNLVTISIHSPFSRNYDLEKTLRNEFDLEIFILKDNQDLAKSDLNFWHFAASHVQQLIKEAKIVSLSWGNTIYKTIDQFSPIIRENLTFTQFIGEFGKYHSLAGSMRLVQKAADCYESNYLTLPAPLYIINDSTKLALTLEPVIAKTLETARHSDLLFTGISTPTAIESVAPWYDLKHLLFKDFDQAVGFLYGRPFDYYGNFLTAKTDKTFGLSLTDTFNIPNRVGICNSKFKVRSIIGALRGGFFTHLIIDEKIALKILDLLEKDEKKAYHLENNN